MARHDLQIGKALEGVMNMKKLHVQSLKGHT